MACNYYFKGQLVGNEIQLTDFLLEKYPYYNNYGDQVFKLTPRALKYIDTIDTKMKIDGDKAQKKLDDYIASLKDKTLAYDEDGRVIETKAPCIGVTKYIANYRDEDGNRLVPEYIKEEYWSRRKQQWINDYLIEEGKNFSEEEIKTISAYEKEFGREFDPKKIYTKAQYDEWADEIQLQWTEQGRLGTVLHAVSELYFGETSDGRKVYEVFEEDPSKVSSYYGTQFANKVDKTGKVKYGDYVKYEQYVKMIEMCQRLRKQLTDKYGECKFYPELTVSTKTSAEVDGCDEMVGIIDLLVVDEKGKTHVFDYKTSPKTYPNYSKPKKRGFTLQLAIYDRILQKYGLNTFDGTCEIIPIQLEGFGRKEGKYTFDNVAFEITEAGVETKSLTNNIHNDIKMNKRLDEFIPVKHNLNPTSENLLEKVSSAEKEWTPSHQRMRNRTDEEIDKMLEDSGAYTPTKEGTLEYRFNSGENGTVKIEITHGLDEAKKDLFKKVKKTIESWSTNRHRTAERFIQSMLNAQETGVFEFGGESVGSGNSIWLQEIMKPYCTGEYEIEEDKNALNFGMIYLKNIKSGAVTVLKLASSDLTYQHEFVKGRTNMTGNFEEDSKEDSKTNSFMLKSINGNLEALEAMHVLQNTQFEGQVNITEIKVINPYQQKGMPVSNKELLYTYKQLMKKKDILGGAENKFEGDNPQIKMLIETEKLKSHFYEILGTDKFSKSDSGNDLRKKIEDLNALDWNSFNRQELYDRLNILRLQMEEAFSDKLKRVHRDINVINSPENRLYNGIMMTMLELKNMDVRQQIEDADNWLQHKTFGSILKHGLEGLNLENPGNFRSKVLNQITKSVNNVYQKVKDVLNKENVTVRKLVEDVKKQNNFGWIRSQFANQTDLYKKMIKETTDGDLLFVNPDTLQGAEKKFLEHVLETINKQRHANVSDDMLEAWKKNGDAQYYQVPIMAASTGSKMSTTNYVKVLKDRLKTWTPKGALEEMQTKAAGILSPEEDAAQDDKSKIFDMTNRFASGESADHRIAVIKKLGGVNGVEHNIETLLLAHSYAYNLKNEMDKEMPLIKASALALSMEGAGANFGEGNFDNLLNFVEKYVKAKVKNESVNGEALRPWEAISGKVRGAASFLALAFSPLQFTYQSLEGIWKGCSLIIKKPDGTDTFTAKNMWDAFKTAYKDLAHYSEKPTLCQLFNEAYGLNDMDANQFAQRIGSDHGIWTHFTDFAFKFASRPDFYNRLTIWGAQMRADGSWDAHHIDKDGKLVYDCKKDKRYAAYFDDSKIGTPEYEKARSMYLAAAQQFEIEGVTDEDGKPFIASAGRPPKPLPRAYTNMEAQGMKAIADNMYGYYNHENRSMMNSMFLGSLATQMKTYWSAKKNQYLAPGGVKLIGHWENYKEDGVQMYYAKNDAGEIDLSKGLVKEGDANSSGVPVTQWKGQWQEGIISTLYKFHDRGDNSLIEQWHNLWDNEDENLKTAYRSNIKHLALDIFFIAMSGLLVGMLLEPWDEEYKKEFYKNQGNTTKATEYMMSHFLTNTFDRSFMDFKFYDSIFSPTIDWQPFAFSSVQRLVENSTDWLFGDTTAVNALANSVSVAKQVKPLLKSLTYNDL